MIKHLVLISLLAVPLAVFSTGYTWGSLEDWLPRLEVAEEYLSVQYTEEEKDYDPDKKATAKHVYGFLSGLHGGPLIESVAKLKLKYGEDIPQQKLVEETRTICMDDAYFTILRKLNRFIDVQQYNRDEEFLNVFLDFAISEYKCI